MKTEKETLLELVESEIEQAKTRQHNLTRDAEIATIKAQVVGEYRFKFLDLRDRLMKLLP